MADKDVKDNSALIVSVFAIVGLVVLNIFAPEVPEYVNIMLGGAALGASWEDIIKWLSRK